MKAELISEALLVLGRLLSQAFGTGSNQRRVANAQRAACAASQLKIECKTTEDSLSPLQSRIRKLEQAATKAASRAEPDTAHCRRRSYEEICEEIVVLKRQMKNEE